VSLPGGDIRCSVLQCVAVCCSVKQCVAVCCSVLQCVAVCCSVLQCVSVCPFVVSLQSKASSGLTFQNFSVASALVARGQVHHIAHTGQVDERTGTPDRTHTIDRYIIAHTPSHTHHIPLGVTYSNAVSKLTAQSSNISFATFQ